MSLFGKRMLAEVESHESSDQYSSTGTGRDSTSGTDRQVKVSDTIPEKSGNRNLEDQLAMEMGESFGSDDTGHSPEGGEDPGREAPAYSARISELHRQQASCKEMRKLVDGTLQTLAEFGAGTDAILNFLQKTEPEISHLEGIATQHSNLREMSIQLAKRTMELKSRLTGQEQEIEILEAMKKRMRNIIEKSRAEIARISEDKEEQDHTLAARDILVSRLSHDRDTLRENNRQFGSRLAATETELKNRSRELEKAKEWIGHMEKQSAVHEKQINSLIEERDQYLLEARSLHKAHSEVSKQHREASAKLEESAYAVEAMRKEYEEKLNSKDARILRLESNNGVLSNQVLFSEEIIASLNAKLDRAQHEEDTGESADGKGDNVTSLKRSAG